jgi:hypothetical protein
MSVCKVSSLALMEIAARGGTVQPDFLPPYFNQLHTPGMVVLQNRHLPFETLFCFTKYPILSISNFLHFGQNVFSPSCLIFPIYTNFKPASIAVFLASVKVLTGVGGRFVNL